ncbi:acyl-CoA dehydrogenase [Corallococcus praedator]|uniref:Acyl-CoA dehydrogenase n=1 Tax=Corallococcus praedator TaxID=2316724 RepID=A0ABX9QBR6_9BACT|nr:MULTISPECIES: acyl-CoA dehydrogenase [Corallococcus]RKH22341.1 acyl-CoA dehydrogenase [Corallococcus sp. CA031C]RKH95184.1 acyl-CoA dehydrogenase [Corallococcus praedator]
MSPDTAHPPAVALDALLRGLDTGDGPFAPARVAKLDREEAFPDAACQALEAFGLGAHYVPTRHGGRLAHYPELVALWRTVARRDLTAAIGHGKTFLGGACTWVGGTPEQAVALGKDVARGARVSWGLTERHHGSDLLAGELSATRTADGWRLNGEKWLINNATRGHLMSVLARTEPMGGPRGFSVFLVDKRQLPAGAFRCLPKERTHGIRGADISGIVFTNADVPATALVGKPGGGIELVLKALQLTRTVAVAMSLGAADHALRLTVDFAKAHQLYERRLVDLPRARRPLGEAATQLLLAEAVSTVGSRALHALTPEAGLTSALTKAFVPTAINDMISQLADLMGARSFLTDVYAHGMFQKVERDHRIIAIFDGSTLVNRNAVINQFPVLVRAFRQERRDAEGLATATTLSAPLPEADLSRLGLVSTAGCSVVQGLPAAVVRLQALVESGALPKGVAYLARALARATDAVHQRMAAQPPAPRDVPPEAFHLAEHYEACFAGAACVHLWLNHANRAPEGPLWRDALWLEACLVRVLSRLSPEDPPGDTGVFDRLADVVVDTTGVFSLLADARTEGAS